MLRRPGPLAVAFVVVALLDVALDLQRDAAEFAKHTRHVCVVVFKLQVAPVIVLVVVIDCVPIPIVLVAIIFVQRLNDS